MSLKWTKIKTQPLPGPQREGPTLTYISSINALLLFGGLTSPTQNQIYLYHISHNCWKIQPTEGRKPTPRRFHTSFYNQQQNILIVNGGQAQKNRSLEDWCVLFVANWRWKRIFLQVAPPSRQLHSLSPWKKQLIVFGGISLPYKTHFNDLWILKNIAAIKSNSSNQIYGPQCSQLTTKGQVPTPRHSHSTYIIKDSLFVIGGQCQVAERQLTCYVLNITKKIWEKSSFDNQLIPQLSKLSIMSPHEEQLLFFGGQIVDSKDSNRKIFKLQLKSFHIKKIQPINTPNALNKMVACSIFNKEQQQIYSIGWDKNNLQFLNLIQVSQENSQTMDIPLEQYLISIKNEQILSQQLIKKNNYLEQLYLTMQKYISQLHNDYLSVDDYNEKVQSQKQKHIGYSLQLKENYGKIQQLYRDAVQNIQKARSQLSAINQQFDKCMETQLDQDQ